jgi:hypothetical protein
MKKRLPSKGDSRIIKKFAWLPEVTDDGYSIWWEHYYVYERYGSVYYQDIAETHYGWFKYYTDSTLSGCEEYSRNYDNGK